MGNGPEIDRRRFLGGAAMAFFASQFGLLGDAGTSSAGAAPAESSPKLIVIVQAYFAFGAHRAPWGKHPRTSPATH